MRLEVIGHSFAYEMECVVRIFFAGAKINVVKLDNFTCANDAESDVKDFGFTDKNVISTRVEACGNDRLLLTVSVAINDFERHVCEEINSKANYLDNRICNGAAYKRSLDADFCERRLGALLFELLCEKTGKRPQWGILTGIRPVRLVRRWSASGLSGDDLIRRLTEDYLVLPHKAELCLKTARAQDKILSHNTPDTFSLYISIPFCPTRCLYCSFVSHEITKAAKLVPDYVELLCAELSAIGKIAKSRGLRLLTVYVGGGTPTALSAGGLRQVLEAVRDNFDLAGLLEYTVEAGRADTVTREKLEVISDFGVGRISINPQSMSDEVLRAVGRAHNSAQVEESFKLARNVGFGEINMDLIAGLPSETFESFHYSLERVIALGPENITVHTLTVKRSSGLRDEEDAFSRLNPGAAMMQEHAAARLTQAGYSPYYLYRQKATAENLENTGFSKPGHEGVYNIFSMEDTHNILAAGAGGVSKLIGGDKGISRIFNYKYPYEYISRFNEILNRKETMMDEGNK